MPWLAFEGIDQLPALDVFAGSVAVIDAVGDVIDRGFLGAPGAEWFGLDLEVDLEVDDDLEDAHLVIPIFDRCLLGFKMCLPIKAALIAHHHIILAGSIQTELHQRGWRREQVQAHFLALAPRAWFHLKKPRRLN
jgi:hypothetical protein